MGIAGGEPILGGMTAGMVMAAPGGSGLGATDLDRTATARDLSDDALLLAGRARWVGGCNGGLPGSAVVP